MAAPNRAFVIGVFDTYEQAERAMHQLLAAGFAKEDIGFAMRHQDLDDPERAEAYGNAAIARTTTGAVAGGVLGAILGGIATLAMPGFGALLLSGMLAMGAGGAIAGGFAGLISTFQLDEEEMRYYEGELAAGRPLVAVRTGDRYSEALAILSDNGARDVNRRQPPVMPNVPPA